jgi:hypothetical protein
MVPDPQSNDTQHNTIQHNNTYHNIKNRAEQHSIFIKLSVTFSQYAECCYARCHCVESRGALQGTCWVKNVINLWLNSSLRKNDAQA